VGGNQGNRIPLAVISLVAAVSLWVAPTAGAAGNAVIEHPVSQSPAEVRDYWTPERMREAQPLDLVAGGKSGTATATPAAEDPDQEIPANLDTTYPFRIHGRLFLRYGSLDASCSATVVTSFSRDLILTAGHCVLMPTGSGALWATNVSFVPAYRNGARPLGTYPATLLGTTTQWGLEGDLAFDLGTINLAPGPGGLIQDALGSRGVTFNRTARSYRGKVFQVFGYPADPAPFYDGERPILCNSPFAGFEAFTLSVKITPCHQQEGASGGGWVLNGSLVNSVTSHSGCSGLNPACTVISGTYFGDTAFKLWSSSAGALPAGRRKQINRCKRVDIKRRQACKSRAETFGAIVR
jgi:V8-like Glu-specific endopeptidase